MHKFTYLTVFILLISFPQFLLAEDKILEPESWSFPGVIEYARKISPNNVEGKQFNSFGLVYLSSDDKLKISTMSAQELQKYADIVTHAYPDAVAKQLPSSCSKLHAEQLNITTVGGVAYISIHAVNLKTREWAKECMVEIQKIFAKIGK
jgi:hypothetical protein